LCRVPRKSVRECVKLQASENDAAPQTHHMSCTHKATPTLLRVHSGHKRVVRGQAFKGQVVGNHNWLVATTAHIRWMWLMGA
jgi:hypothetical protein